MGVLGVIINDSCTCCCYLLSIVVDFRILSDIYADDTYSVLLFCTDPYLYVFFLLIVECSERTVVFNSTQL